MTDTRPKPHHLRGALNRLGRCPYVDQEHLCQGRERTNTMRGCTQSFLPGDAVEFQAKPRGRWRKGFVVEPVVGGGWRVSDGKCHVVKQSNMRPRKDWSGNDRA